MTEVSQPKTASVPHVCQIFVMISTVIAQSKNLVMIFTSQVLFDLPLFVLVDLVT